MLVLGLAFVFSFANIQAQSTSKSLPILLPAHVAKFETPRIARIFPAHIQQNPQELAPLCRMELKIEQKSPIGMWFRIDDNATRSFNSAGLAYFRLRWVL